MRKQIIIVLSILALVSLCGVAIYRYQHRAPVSAGITLQQALNERQDAIKALAIHDAVNTKLINAANTQINTLTSQKGTLCTQLKAARLTNALCL